MGGTFDPVHRGHLELGLAARSEMDRHAGIAAGAGWLVFMPAARNPLKSSGPVLSDARRVELLRLACEGLERVGVSTLEIEDADEAAPVSFTVDTLRKLVTMCPGTRFRLVMGADSARGFHRWRGPREILSLAEPLVVLRRPDESAESLVAALKESGAWTEDEVARWRGWVASTGLVDVSATRVRQLVSAGDWGSAELAAALPAAVLVRLREWGGR